MAFGDTKIVINSLTYDNHSNNILVGVRKHSETEDSQTAEVVLVNADQRFTALNLRGLTAVISYDYGSGYQATPTLTVMTQDDITSGGQYQTVLTLVGIPDLMSEDKASKNYNHPRTSTKTVKDLLTEVLDGTAVQDSVTEEQTTMLGSTSAPITAYATSDAGTKTEVTSAGHGLSNGDAVIISGTTSYNDTWAIEQVATDTFVIPTAFVADDGSSRWRKPPFYNFDGTGDDLHGVGQSRFIRDTTVTTISFYLKKVGSPTGDVTFFMRPTDFSWSVSKVLGDASTLSTSAAWKTVTLDTARYVNDEVILYCEYQGGASSNYVAIGYSSSAVAVGEELGLLYATGDWQYYSDQDCGYKFGHNVDGVDCFTHTTSRTATYDSESTLMDTYQPGDAFKIKEGESKLDVVNKLLGYVSDLKRVESDDAVHFFTTPASGNSYTSDKGEFYTHANRKALVVPNKIVAKSYDEDDGYEGSATSAESFALLPITGVPVRAYLTGSSQGNDVAAAVIARLEVNSQVGSDLVPMNNYEQIWNYVTVTNNWNGSITTGNIAYLNRVSIGGQFQQFFSFGRQAKKGIAGMAPRREVKLEHPPITDDSIIKWGDIKELFNIIDENTDDIYRRLNIIFTVLEHLGVKVDATDNDLSNNVEKLLEGQVDSFSILVDGIVQRLQVTESLKIPGFPKP